MHPINNNKKPPLPISVQRKSDIDAPRGPPRLFMFSVEFLLKKPESAASYETNEIKTYKDNARRKKLKKF